MEHALRAGRFIAQSQGLSRFLAFVPATLPPNPSITWDSELHDLLEIANRALGRLDGATLIAPNPDLFLYTYIRKEAVLSSQIEGTQSSLSDLLLFENAEAPGIPVDDLREVSNYVAAMEHGLKRLKGGFPRRSEAVVTRVDDDGCLRRYRANKRSSRTCGRLSATTPSPQRVLPAARAFDHDPIPARSVRARTGRRCKGTRRCRPPDRRCDRPVSAASPRTSSG